MKKSSLLIIVFALMTSMMVGQIKFGPKIGFNASKLSTSVDSIKSKFKSGFQFGAFVRIGGRVYLQPELYYTSEGGVFEKDSLGKSWKQNISLGSLNIPVLVGFKIINSELINLRVLAGPVMSFVVNKKISNLNSLYGPVQQSNISNANWYIQAGAGVDVWKFTLDIRYQLGLNKIIKDVTFDGKNINFNTSNNVWVVSLGFKI